MRETSITDNNKCKTQAHARVCEENRFTRVLAASWPRDSLPLVLVITIMCLATNVRKSYAYIPICKIHTLQYATLNLRYFLERHYYCTAIRNAYINSYACNQLQFHLERYLLKDSLRIIQHIELNLRIVKSYDEDAIWYIEDMMSTSLFNVWSSG